MKKSAAALGIVVAVGLVYTAGAWYVGKKAQDTILHCVDQANQRAAGMLGAGLEGGGLKLVVNDYRRHVFSSDMVFSVEIKGADGKPIEFMMSDHLDHGPFPWSALRSGRYKPMLAYSQAELMPTAATQKWFDAVKGRPPVTGSAQVDFSGAIQSAWNFKALAYQDQGSSVRFGGGTVHIAAAGDGKNNNVDGHFAALAVTRADTGEQLEVQGVALRSATTTPEADSTRVKSAATIENLQVVSEAKEAMRVQKLAIEFDSQQKGHMLDASLRYDFGRIVAGGAELGSVTAGAKASHLDTDALAALAGEYDALKAKHGDNLGATLSDDEAQALRKKLLDLLASSPELAIDPVVWKNDKGQSTVTLKVDLASPAGDPAVADMQGFDVLLPQVLRQVRLDASISRPMFIEATAQLSKASGQPASALPGTMLFDHYAGNLQAAGLLRMQGDAAVAAIQYKDGRIEANGNAMSVQEFLQRALVSAM